MICPYCGKEMKKGYIPAAKMALMWIPESDKVPVTIFSKTKTGVNLTDVPIWKMQKATSFYCTDCRVVVTPVEKQ